MTNLNLFGHELASVVEQLVDGLGGEADPAAPAP